MPSVVASFPSVISPAPLPRRAITVFGVAGLALTCMAAGLGLAFPSLSGSRSGSGARVTPILVTPARSAPSSARFTTTPSQANSSVLTPASASTKPATTAVSVPAPTTQTTLPPDVVNQVNQTVTDVLGTLVPPQSGSK